MVFCYYMWMYYFTTYIYKIPWWVPCKNVTTQNTYLYLYLPIFISIPTYISVYTCIWLGKHTPCCSEAISSSIWILYVLMRIRLGLATCKANTQPIELSLQPVCMCVYTHIYRESFVLFCFETSNALGLLLVLHSVPYGMLKITKPWIQKNTLP